MNAALKALLQTLLNKRCIGGKHTPEEKLIKSKIRWLEPQERKEFEKEYKQMINESIISRSKKMTGKGSDWHVSLNPRTLKELYEKIS
ncbi:MAG: hypothetical protein Q8R53_03140 [Nanoarchaeota archaeon]|nr:hypothetical protein [Nanoarchaeota archaeon]